MKPTTATSWALFCLAEVALVVLSDGPLAVWYRQGLVIAGG